MNPKILSTLMAATLGILSVSGPAASQTLLRPDPDENPLERESAYTEKRWMGLLREGISECPSVPGWDAQSLLDSAQVSIPRADRGLLHKLGLDRYCIYDALEGAGAFATPAGLLDAERDRMALSTTSAGGPPADTLSQKIWPALAARFHGQAGQEPSLALTGPPAVRLTFIDSHPTGEGVPSEKPGPGDSMHGFTLAHLARGLVCPSPGPCAVTFATRRALGYGSFDPENPLPGQQLKPGQSGHVGLVSDLAAAILAEVLAWRSAGTPRHLILNLSLGWDGEGFDDLDAHRVSELEPSVRAVYNALQFARRSGVLVIAASGNSRGGLQESGWPLLPAAWEMRRVGWWPIRFARQPVYAVGGVDWQGLPLSNSRRGGHPRRVAYADHSVTRTDVPDDPTAMYTGTSVSSAVASSIAAAVWHLRPELRPAQVMRLITRAGDRLAPRADFYTWRDLWPLSEMLRAPRTRRLSLCPAVARACGADGKHCSPVPCVPAEPLPLREHLANLKGFDRQASELLSPDPVKELLDVTSVRWVIPQPEATPCPSCTLVPDPPPGTTSESPETYALVMEISPTWQTAEQEGIVLEGATLDIDRFVSPGVAKRKSYKLGLSPEDLKSGEVLRLAKLGDGKPLKGCRAQITFQVRKNGKLMSIQNPVIVDP